MAFDAAVVVRWENLAGVHLSRPVFQLLACACLTASLAFGLDPYRAITQYARANWQTDQGLPENGARAILQATDGHLWVGTNQGVARFDGVAFTAFNHLNTPGFPSKRVTALLADADGGVWIGTDEGLAYYLNGKWKFYGKPDGLASAWIASLLRDSHGTLWAGTRSGGLLKFQQGRFVSIAMGEDSAKRSFYDLAEGADGTLWAATGHGLRSLHNGVAKVYLPEDGLPALVCSSLAKDPDGSLWVGTYSGLSHFSNGKFTNFGAQEGLVGDKIQTLLRDRDGNLWIGMNGGGLNRFHGGRFDAFGKKEGLAGVGVFGLCEDREGNLWIGTTGGGLYRLQDGKVTPIGVPEGLAGDYVYSIAGNSKGAVWISTDEGVSLIDGGNITLSFASKDLGGNSVYAVMVDRKDRLWIAVADGTVRLMEGVSQRKFVLNADSALPAGDLHEDRDGSVWAATGAGLVHITTGRIERVHLVGGGPGDTIETILDDPQGGLLVATYGGIARLQNGRLAIAYTMRDGLPSNLVYKLLIDRDGTLWATTSKGLCRRKGGKFIALPDVDGSELMEDGQGRLWMGSIRGPFMFTKKQFDDAASGVAHLEPMRFGTADGIRNAECNTAGWKTPDGRLWFATHRGAAIFDPTNLKKNSLPPPVAIEALWADEHPVDTTIAARLAAGTRRVEVKYAGLSFQAPNRVLYRCKLEGTDPGWRDVGTRNEASYTNLGPGKYRFRVKACNNDGVWSERDAGVSFFVLPHYYQTWWFFALCGTAILLAARQLYMYRIRQIEGRFAMVLGERTRIARELHDTLLQSFSGLALHIQAASNKIAISPQGAREQLNTVLLQIESSLSEARQAVWDIRASGNNTASLAGKLKDCGEQIARAAGVEIRTAVYGEEFQLPKSTEMQVVRIAQEAVRNATRHAQAAVVTLQVKFTSERLMLTVSDDGCGFDLATAPGPEAGHFGLTGLAERARGLGGELAIESAPGKGTTIDVIIPCPPQSNGVGVHE